MYPKFQKGEWGSSLLEAEIDMRLPPALPASDEHRKLAKRQANAAVALLRMNRPKKVWPLLKYSPDPRVRSYLHPSLSAIESRRRGGRRRPTEPDITIRRALVLSLGGISKELPPAARNSLLPKLQAMYRTDADPGLHAAVEVALRTWKQQVWLKQMNDAWAKDQEQRAKRIESIQQLVKKDREKAPPQWYVNGQGQTIVVIPGPVEGFVMGSPVTEAGRSGVDSCSTRSGSVGRLPLLLRL